MRKNRLRTGTKAKRTAFWIAMIALVAILSVVACSLDWNGLFPAGETGGVVDNLPNYAVSGEIGEKEVGQVADDYNPDRSGWIALNNANFESTFGDVADNSAGLFYLTENITSFSGFRHGNRTFWGTLDGNGFSVVVTGAAATEGDNKIPGGLVSMLFGVIKNLTVIYNTSITYTKSVPDKNYSAVGLLAGALRENGTIENVKVAVNSGVTVKVDSGGGEMAVGGIVGVVGHTAGSTQTIRNCVFQCDGILEAASNTWHWTGGLAGEFGCNFLGSVNGVVENFLLSGSGTIKATGSYGDANSRRVGGITGGLRKGTLNVKGFVLDLTGTGLESSCTSSTAINDGSSDAKIYYAYTSRSNKFEQNKTGTNTQFGSIATTTEGVSLTAVPTLSNTGNLLMKLTLSESYYELYGYNGGTQLDHKSSDNYQTVKLNLGAISGLTTGGAAFKVKAIAPVSVNASNPGAFIDALKNGAAIYLNADIDLGARAFEANAEYRARIIGGSHSVTLTGVSGSAYSGTTQGGLVKSLNGAKISGLTVIYRGDITRSCGGSSPVNAGLIAGEVFGNSVLTNVRVKVTGGTTALTNADNISAGGFFGVASGAVTMGSCVFEVDSGAKFLGGSTSSAWTWTAGIFGELKNPAGGAVALDKVAVVGDGTIEGQGATNDSQNKRAAGLIGGLDASSAGGVTVSDFVYGLKNLVGNNTARILCFDGSTTPVNVRRFYYLDTDIVRDSSSEQQSAQGVLNVTNSTKILKTAYDNTGAAMPAAPVSVSVDAAFSKIRLTVPLVAFDPEYLWVYQLKDSGGTTLSSQNLDSAVPSYAFDAELKEHVELKILMKQTRSLALPADADQYEHGYVPSGYEQRQGYDGNSDWVEISDNLNTSALGDLSDDRNYWLSSDVTIGGFVSTHAFSGVLDGCGHTITINADGAGNGKDGSLGGLFAELAGVVKNVRIVVKTDVARTSGVLRAGLLAGLADSGAKIYNVKASLDRASVSVAGGSTAITLGGLVGLVKGSNEVPVEISGATVELNGTLKADGDWSWLGGIVGRVGNAAADTSPTTAETRKLIAKQIVFRGNGVLNNVDRTGTTERTGGFAGAVGGYGAAATASLEVDGDIFGYEGKATGDVIVKGAGKDAANVSANFRNVFTRTGGDPVFTAWCEALFGDKAVVTNESEINAAFIQSGFSDISLGYTVALFDPRAVNAQDGTVVSTDALIVLSIFEDDGKLQDLFVADVEIIYADQSHTGTDAVALVNVFKLTPEGALGTITVQIRAGSANDGNASIDGDRYIANNAGYTSGWLTDNGRVPAMYGIPKGATAIADKAALANWAQGRDASGVALAADTVAYLYGYLTTDFRLGADTWSDYPLAAGRTLDGAGHTLSVQTGNPNFGLASNQTGWIRGADSANQSAKLYGELFSKNDGTIKNLTVDIKDARAGELNAGEGVALVQGGIVGVNNGRIENVKTIVSGSTTVGPKVGTGAGALIFGGIAGVNRGTIRYATIENNGVVDCETTSAKQKIAGGIAGVNDGGTIEYAISSGSGIYQIGNSVQWPFLGGAVGLANVSTATPATFEFVFSGNGNFSPAAGVFRYVLHNFSGNFKTNSGITGNALFVGALAGALMPWNAGAPAVDANHTAIGLYAAVKNGGNTYNYGFFQTATRPAAGAIAYTGLIGVSTGAASNTNLGGGNAIDVNFNGTANAVAGGAEHHFWWDYWGGSGELRYEVYRSAQVNSMTASGAGSSVNPDRGTAYFNNRAANSGNLISSSITTTLYADSYLNFLNGIAAIGVPDTSGSNSGTDLASAGVLNGSQVRLTGGGNYYLSKDVEMMVYQKTGEGQAAFSGTFDGRGHTIYIRGSGLDDATGGSNFGFIMDACSGTFKNVNIVYEASSVKTYCNSRNDANGRYNAGIVCGDFWGTMENVTFTMASGSDFWFEVTRNGGRWNGEWLYSCTGMLAGRQGGGTIKNCRVNLSGGTLKANAGAGGSYGSVGYHIGIVGWQENATIQGLYVTGNGTSFTESYKNESGVERLGGLIVGKQSGTNTVNNIYLEGVGVTFSGDKNFAGILVQSTISNVFLIGENTISGVTPTQGSPATAFGSTLNAMIKTLSDAQGVKAAIPNGVGGSYDSGASDYDSIRNLYLSVGTYTSGLQPSFKMVVRYPELGYYLEELKSVGVPLSASNGESTYVVGTVTKDTKFPDAATIGIRGKINLIENTTDALGNSVPAIADSAAYSQVYNGSDKTAFEFRATFWGDGTAGAGSTAPLGWNAGGAVVSGRVPFYVDDTNQPYVVTIDKQNENYAFQNVAGRLSIPIGAVQFEGEMRYTVTRARIAVGSDTDAAGSWKSQGRLTVAFDTPAVDGAIDQLVYTSDADPDPDNRGGYLPLGADWRHVLKCNNFTDGMATATVNTESKKGGTTYRFRAYSGIYIVSDDTVNVLVRVDKSYPNVAWEAGSEPLSTESSERVLVVDDASVGDLAKADGVLTITGPEGHNLDYTLDTNFKTNGKIRVFSTGSLAAKSGDYTFTVKDAMGYQTAIRERLDFTPPKMTATVSAADNGAGVTGVANPKTSVGLSLSDNYTDVRSVLNTLKVYVYRSGDRTPEALLHTLSVAPSEDPGVVYDLIDTTGFSAQIGSGSIVLDLPERYFPGTVDFVFEVKDAAGNAARVEALHGVVLDTRVYTIGVEKYKTADAPYATGGLSYRLNGMAYTASPGETTDILHTIRAHLFDTLEIVYQKKDGYTYDGFDVKLSGVVTAACSAGTNYIVGGGDDDRGDEVARKIVFRAAEELKLSISTTAEGAGALRSGSYSDTLSDYFETNPETLENLPKIPNLLAPNGGVYGWNAETRDYTTQKIWTFRDYFNFELTDPNGHSVSRVDITVDSANRAYTLTPNVNGAYLTFAENPDEPGRFIEGAYTLTLRLKEEYAGVYAVLDGATATFNVSSKSRRKIDVTYNGTTDFTYGGTVDILNQDGTLNASAFGSLSFAFAAGAFDEEPQNDADQANLEALRAGVARLNYTLYYNGELIGQKIGSAILKPLAIRDVGTYFLTVSIPVTGTDKFVGVTGSEEIVFNVRKKSVTVRADNQSVLYGEKIDPDAYSFDGIDPSDLTADYGSGSVRIGHLNSGVMISNPRLLTEYTLVRIVGGAVAPYQNGISLSGGIAKNYEFTLVSGDITILKRGIVLKIEDATKTYGFADPGIEFWGLSETAESAGIRNWGFAYSDNFLSFSPSDFRRDSGESAYTGANGTQIPYAITGVLFNQNYEVAVEPGVFTIARRALTFRINGDSGLVFEEGTRRSITAKISNGLTSDKLSVRVEYGNTDWTSIGTHQYRLVVAQNGVEDADLLLSDYSYDAGWVDVVIGASILNIVVLPQILTYGDEPLQGENCYVLEGIKAEDVAKVTVRLFIPVEYRGVGCYAGAIAAEVTFTGGDVQYTPAVRKGNLTVLPKEVELRWSGTFDAVYTGEALDKKISAKVSTQTVDPLNVRLSFESKDGLNSSPIGAGSYAVTASLNGTNAENYVVRAEDRSRQFVVQKSEQRISVGSNHTYNPQSSTYPTFETELQYKMTLGNGGSAFVVWRARISYNDLLSVMVNSATGYRITNSRMPTIELFSVESISATGVVNSEIRTFAPSGDSYYFDLEAGTYNATATLAEEDNYYKNTYFFTFVVTERQVRQDTSAVEGNSIDKKDVTGSITVDSLGQTVQVKDASKIGYVVGPNNKHDARPVKIENGTVSRLMANSLEGSWNGSAYNSKCEDTYYGSHDGDWAYTYFNVAVSEEIRQLILQGKVDMKLNVTAASMSAGVQWYRNFINKWVHSDGVWREDGIDTTNLSYMVREISSAEDYAADPANGNMIGLATGDINDLQNASITNYDINGTMAQYGAGEGFTTMTNGVELLQNGALSPYDLYDRDSADNLVSRRVDKTSYARNVSLGKDKLKSGAAFRVYFLSTTLGPTRTNIQITGDLGKQNSFLGNKRNNFLFENISVSFVEKTDAKDTVAPEVTPSAQVDALTGGVKYRFTVRDTGSGIDFSSVSAVVNGLTLTPGNGLNLSLYETKERNMSPILQVAHFETGFISGAPSFGIFHVKDYAGNVYDSVPSLVRDTVSPTLSDLKLTDPNLGDVIAEEKFWYNRKRFLSINATDTGGTIAETGIYCYDENGRKQTVRAGFDNNRITSLEELGTGLYYLFATDSAGNTTTVTFNLLVDDSAEGGSLEIVPDPNVSSGGGDMWLNGNVAIANSVSAHGDSFGRMYYATAPAGTANDETRFKNSYRTDASLQWLAMDAEVVDGKFVLSENITTATKKYYAFKYVSGAASAPNVNDNATAYYYLGLIQIDRDEPTVIAESYVCGSIPNAADPTGWTDKSSVNSGTWTNKPIVFELSGTVGLSKGAIEWTKDGIDAEDALWYRTGDAGYDVYYYDYNASVYTQTLNDTDCFRLMAGSGTIFEYKAYLVVRGPDIGNTYAFRFRNRASSVANAELNVSTDHSDKGFRVAIDTIAPEVSHINSSWQPDKTKSQIYINETQSGVRSVKVVKQQTDGNGDGVFLNGQPVYDGDETAKDAEFTNNRYYYTFGGVYYKITVTDVAGNVGTKEVKLKIDERDPEVALQNDAAVYSSRYVADGAAAEGQKLGEGVYAYRDASGAAFIKFFFHVKGGISGYTFAYSKVGYSTIESDWIKPGGKFDVGECGDNEGGYQNTFEFRLDGDRAERYLFRFTSGAQKSVYFNFVTGKAETYQSGNADQYLYRVNIDATPATADAFEFNLGDAQWRPLGGYDDAAWITSSGELPGVGIRFVASENSVNGASTGLGRVTWQETGGEEIEIPSDSGYYVFYLTRSKDYSVRVYDKAGNVSTYLVPAKKIDLTAPKIEVGATAGGASYETGTATNCSVTLSYALSYGDSGIASILFEKDGVQTSYSEAALREGLFFEADFIGVVKLTIRNGAGIETVSEFALVIDKTDPDVEITGLPQEYTTDPVDVTVTPIDPLGSGVRSATMTYRGDDGSPVSVDVKNGYTFSVRDWREYVVTVEDNAGNTATKRFTAQVNATVPEAFSMTASVGGAPYVSGRWSAAPVRLTFLTTFSSVDGVINYGAFEYSVDGGEWRTLFQAADYVADGDPNRFIFDFTGEVDGRYAFRAVTSAGKPSAATATIESLKIDTVSPVLSAEGRVGGDGGAQYRPDTEKGYTWISANVEVTFGCTLGISGGKLYVDYKAAAADAYRRAAIADLTKESAVALRYTISEEGYYRFGLNANADLSDAAASVVDYGEIRIDTATPSVSVSSKQSSGDGFKNYTLATWTKENVFLVVETIVGKSRLDSRLLFVKGDAASEYAPVANYDPSLAEAVGDGTYRILTTVEISENSASNYDFRVESGAGTFASAEVYRSGGAVRIDKVAPKLTIESVRAGGADYAKFEGGAWTQGGWINQNLTFTFLVRTYLSGGNLKYYYDGLAGYTSENIASYGSASSGEDENGAYSERRYTLTLAGENFAMDATLKFRVESGAGAVSNAEGDQAACVPVKIDKTRPSVDENSVTKTPNVQGGVFTKEEVKIRFRAIDPEIVAIASGVASVEFGMMSGMVFVRIGDALTPGEDGYYTVTIGDYRDYLIRVTDLAGNVSDRTVKENVDRVEPTIAVVTDYIAGSLSTSPIPFTFAGSSYGVSGAKAQYRLGADGAWIDAADVGATFEFRETLFSGTLYFRLLSGSGIASAEESIEINQDRNDYRVTVSEQVVAVGSYAASVSYQKNGTATSAAPLMKKGETLTVTIVEKAEYPLYKVYVDDREISFAGAGSGRYSFELSISGDTDVRMQFKEIVSVAFDANKTAQSIRVKNGVNTPVTEPFVLTRENRPGFEYSVLYKRVGDAYGNAVADGETSVSVPQTLGTYRLTFTVTGDYTDLYSFADTSEGVALKVYYFDKIQTANVSYYAVETAYDLAYIRYAVKDGVEFRQTRDLNVTASVVSAEGGNRTRGDWTVGDFTEGAYNGANFKITLQKLDGAGTPLFGAIAAGATVKNIGFVAENPRLGVANGGVWAPIAASVAGLVQNVYASGSVRITGENVSVGGLVGTVAAGGTVKGSYAGLAVDLIEAAGDGVRAGGVAVENFGAIEKVFSVGSATGTERFRSGNMLAVTGNGSFAEAVTIESALYAGTEALESVYPDAGVTVVKYWDLNDRTKRYWDTAILGETISPKADQVSLKELIDEALNGLTFETDENNNRYVPIANFEALGMVDKYLWADFRQTADIDAGGKALAIAKNAPFSGSFNGNGFVIENISVGAADGVEKGYGLFGNVTGTIENVVLKEFTFNARAIAASDVTVGGLVRNLAGGTVRNVSVGGTILAGVPGGTLTVGGAVGRATGGAIIDRVLSTVSVTTDGATKLLYAGSIVGAITSSSVRNVYSIAKVDANYEKRAAVGQLIGVVNRGEGGAAEAGYAVMGVTYRNGQGGDSVIGYDEAGVANADSFTFTTFDEMMDAARHPDYTVNGRHISATLKTLFPFERGTGVQNDPFEIRTAEEFLLIGNYLYAHYNVVSDIEFTGNFETIGKGMYFTGSIKGMNLGEESVKKLVGVTDALVDQNRGTIQGLEIQSNVVKSVEESTVFGAVANMNYGTISFVKANGTIVLEGLGAAGLTVGGIAGRNEGKINNSNANFTTALGAANLRFGGIAGVSIGGELYENAVQGSATATALGASVGMFAGGLSSATTVTRLKDTGGGYVDVFLSLTINGAAIAADQLSGFTV